MQNKRSGYLLIVVMAVSLMTVVASAQHARVMSQPSESITASDNWFMNSGDNERGLQLNFKGRIEFRADYRDVATLSRNGFVRMRETRGDGLKRLEIEADKDGNVQRAYFVNEQARPFDQEARLWLATVMRAAVREGGYEAPRRVAHLYQQGGADAVLAIIPLLKDDYGRRVYFEQLLTRHSLEASLVPRVIQQIAQDINSAYEKREALNAVPHQLLSEPAVVNELIAAAATLDSDHERGLMLADFAQGDELTGDQLNGVLQLVRTLAKPYDKAEALLALHRGQAHVAWQPAFFMAVNSVGAAFEQSRVLLAVMGTRRVESAVLKLVIEAAAHISQDYEMAGVLLRAATCAGNNEALRQQLTLATKNLRSEYERGRVLAALSH